MISKKVAHLKFDRNTRGVETCTHAKMHKNCSATTNLFALQRYNLNDTGEDSKLVHRRKRPKVDASIFDSALSHTRRSDASKKKRRK